MMFDSSNVLLRPARTPITSLLALAVCSLALFVPAANAVNTAEESEAQRAKRYAKEAADSSILRICAASDELPMSKKDGSGFENKIAVALAEAMGRTPKFVWYDKPSIYLVRDQLKKMACDVVIGVDTGDPRVATSKPYYRASYVFVTRKNSNFDLSKGWESPDLTKAGKIGFTPSSPAQVMMEKMGLYQDNLNYMYSLVNFKNRRNQFIRVPAQRMVNEVADETADLAVNFAPEVARYVKENDSLELVVIPDNNQRSDGESVPHHFDQSLAVREDADALLKELNTALDKAAPKIQDILKSEGIPLLPQLPPT